MKHYTHLIFYTTSNDFIAGNGRISGLKCLLFVTNTVLSCAILLLDYSWFFQELSHQKCYESKGIRNLFPFEYLLPNHPINSKLQVNTGLTPGRLKWLGKRPSQSNGRTGIPKFILEKKCNSRFEKLTEKVKMWEQQFRPSSFGARNETHSRYKARGPIHLSNNLVMKMWPHCLKSNKSSLTLF